MNFSLRNKSGAFTQQVYDSCTINISFFRKLYMKNKIIYSSNWFFLSAYYFILEYI